MSDTSLRKFMRLADVKAATGLPTSTIYEMMARQTFPANFRLSDNGKSVAWDEADIIAWQEARLRDRAAA